MKPATTIAEAKAMIDSYRGRPEGFELPIANELLDPMGISMALITDVILAREWEPDGYTEANGCRIYKYKALGS